MVSPMRLIKFTHACVRLEDGDRRLLIDPGIWTEREAYEGVTDILVTHEHDDHIDIERIRSLLTSQELRIFAPQAVQALVMEDNDDAPEYRPVVNVPPRGVPRENMDAPHSTRSVASVAGSRPSSSTSRVIGCSGSGHFP